MGGDHAVAPGCQLGRGCLFTAYAPLVPVQHGLLLDHGLLLGTHDIAADGFYMLGLDNKQQAFFVGIRNTFYRLAMISGQGLLIIFAGWLEKIDLSVLAEKQASNALIGWIFHNGKNGTVPFAWMSTFLLMAVLFPVYEPCITVACCAPGS